MQRHSLSPLVAAPLVAMTLVGAPPPSAHAHLGNVSYSDIVVEGDTVFYRLKFAAHLIPAARSTGRQLTHRDVVALEPAILAWIERALLLSTAGQPCSPSVVDSTGPDLNDDLTLVLAFGCPHVPESLRIEFLVFEGALDEYQNIVSLEIGSTSLGYVFTQEDRLLVFGETEASRSVSPLRRFFALGVGHILSGYDHLLFLLALLLPGGTLWRLAGIITAFTVAHSVTLSLATLGLVNLPPAPVEVAIAASIVYVAAANLRVRARDHRRRITFIFGLVHGFGFAGMLAAAGLPPQGVFEPLLAFNLGVEVGQLAVVVVAVPLITAAMRSRLADRVRFVGSWLIIAAGTFWMIERIPDLVKTFSH